MTQKNEELIGTVISVWYPSSTKASGSDFVIVTIYDRDGMQHRCKGEAKEGTFAPNLDYTFYGLWKDHPTHGRAFQFKQVVHREPLSRKGVFEYLLKYVPHIGPATVNALLRSYNPDSMSLMGSTMMTLNSPGWIVLRISCHHVKTSIGP